MDWIEQWLGLNPDGGDIAVIIKCDHRRHQPAIASGDHLRLAELDIRHERIRRTKVYPDDLAACALSG